MDLDIRGRILQYIAVKVINIFRLGIVISFSSTLTNCAIFPDKGEKPVSDVPAEVSPPQMKIPVGTVHHVDTAGGFVLIRSSRQLQIEPGTLITVFGDQGETAAMVKVGLARKGPFITADILSGLPKSGQRTAMDQAPPKWGDSAVDDQGESGAESDIQVLE